KLLDEHVWSYAARRIMGNSAPLDEPPNSNLRDLCYKARLLHFENEDYAWSNDFDDHLKLFKKHLLTSEWYEFYNFIEFILENYGRKNFRPAFISELNLVLERHMSAYR